ncbi:unnamed protein product, partial [Mesorhabditis spiculigera]
MVQRRRFAVRAMDDAKRVRKFAVDQPCSQPKVDLMLVLDTSGSVHNAFDKERAFALDLVERFEEQDFEDRIRVSVIRFASDAQIVVPYREGTTKKEVLETIRNIEFTGQNTRIATAVELGVAHLEKHQRQDAQQIFVLISDGHGQEFWNVVQATGKRLQETEWEIFSVTASRDFNLEELKMYAGEDARVFIGPKSGSFLPIVGKFIDRCIEKRGTVEGSGQIEPSEPKKKQEKEVEGSGVEDEATTQTTTTEGTLTTEEASNCNLDIILVVDRSQSVETDYQKELKTATDVVGLASKSAYETGQVRVGVTSFAREGKLEIPLRKATRANTTDMISSIYHTGGSTSAVAGVEQAIRHLLPERRPKTRLLVVLISDGHSQDFWDKLTKTARILQALPNSLLLAATNSEKYSLSELTAWTGNASHVFHSQQIPVFLDRDQIIANVASKVQEIEGSGDVEGSGDGVITTDAVIEKNTPANHTDEPLTDSHEQKPRGVSDPLNEGIPLVTRPGTIKSTFDGKGPCKVDLVFVVDISTSVEQEFEKQRQFTLDLVNRLPREDFDNRVHVGIIVFHNRARVVEPLGRQRTKESIINVLSNITDEGGSTSVAAGMKLAADEITRGRRSDARQMVVLVSDGNSQDLWRQVILTSGLVKALAVDVYAITVHRDYLYKELEMYSSGPDYVFVGPKIPEFLDVTERALLNCLAPNVTLDVEDRL